jgi:protein involved in polysaccharide export with SLBB domain
MPTRGIGPVLNFANLTARPPRDYILGPGDILDVTVAGLFQGAETKPIRAEIMGNGEVILPLVGNVHIGGLNVIGAQQAITRTYADGFLDDPRVNVSLAVKKTIDCVVLGEVNNPGVVPLPKYQNDVGHALALAGGLSELADDMIEIHRRTPAVEDGDVEEIERWGFEEFEQDPDDPKKILRIPLRGLPPGTLTDEDVLLNPGDVIVVPDRKADVFWVVGKLSPTNLVRFSLGDRERELGAGLVIPRDRDIDVVTAVAMAGYIDPIDSPTTVTVHRVRPDGRPLLVKVDLIKARYNRRENIFVQPGDIIYLNPDCHWYFRRTFDRIVPDILISPYSEWMRRMIRGR